MFSRLPVCEGFDYEPLWRFMRLTGNNLGDPFEPGTYRVNSHEFECEVIDFFAQLFRAPAREFWGTSPMEGPRGTFMGCISPASSIRMLSRISRRTHTIA